MPPGGSARPARQDRAPRSGAPLARALSDRQAHLRAMFDAIEQPTTDVLRRLLSAGYDPNLVGRLDDPSGAANPLTKAIHARNLPAVELLLSHGADPDRIGRQGETPINAVERLLAGSEPGSTDRAVLEAIHARVAPMDQRRLPRTHLHRTRQAIAAWFQLPLSRVSFKVRDPDLPHVDPAPTGTWFNGFVARTQADARKVTLVHGRYLPEIQGEHSGWRFEVHLPDAEAHSTFVPGHRLALSPPPAQVASPVDPAGVPRQVPIEDIRFTQAEIYDQVNSPAGPVPLEAVVADFAAHGWDPALIPPVHLVEGPGGFLRTLDHRRLTAATLAGLTSVPAHVHGLHDPLPADLRDRPDLVVWAPGGLTDPLTGTHYPRGHRATTYGEASTILAGLQRAFGHEDFPLDGTPELPKRVRRQDGH